MTVSRILPIVALWIAAANTVSAQPPSNLFEWLKTLHSDEFKLCSAIDQNGYWFAVRTDSDGDILFSYHRHDGREADDSECTLRIEDKHGTNLHDFDSAKRNPEPIKIVSKRQMVIGDATTETEFTYTYLSGVIFPLKSNAPGPIVVTYTTKHKDGKTSELFRQQISPPNSSDNKRMNRSRRQRGN